MSVTINGTTGIDQVQDSIITLAKLASNSVNSSKIVDGSITNTDLTLQANDSNIKTALNASGDSPIYACRAWVNFDATRNSSGGTDALLTNRFIRASGNVTSVLKNATGDYTVNFTTAMPDANYTANVTSRLESGVAGYIAGTHTFSTSSLRVQNINASGLTLVDTSFMNVTVFR